LGGRRHSANRGRWSRGGVLLLGGSEKSSDQEGATDEKHFHPV
jgi:hypothetical protein